MHLFSVEKEEATAMAAAIWDNWNRNCVLLLIDVFE